MRLTYATVGYLRVTCGWAHSKRQLASGSPARAGLTPEQIDVWEVHEAFSAQALGVLRELPSQLDGWQVPDEKLNLNGGAVSIGHPFGATGARYALTLALEL